MSREKTAKMLRTAQCKCGAVIKYTGSRKPIYCEKCKKERRRKSRLDSYYRYKSENKATQEDTQKTSLLIKFKSITEVLSDLERFNKENGKHLTYGQYVGKLYLEEMKIKAYKKKKRGKRQ